MTGRNINIHFKEENFNFLRDRVQNRKISSYINSLIEKDSQQFRQQELKKLADAYLAQNSNQMINGGGINSLLEEGGENLNE